MDEDGESDNGREEEEEEEEDEEDGCDEDDDNGQTETTTGEDRRIAAMLQEQQLHRQMCSTSAQILQMLSHFMPGVPENAQVVKLESVSDDSDGSVSTPRSESTDTPGSGSGDNSDCVIWAEPIMSCQIVPVWKPPCDDVRRLPPGVRPEDVKRENAGRGRGSAAAAAAAAGNIGLGRSCTNRLYRPGQWNGCLGTNSGSAGRLRNLESGDTNTGHGSTSSTTGPGTVTKDTTSSLTEKTTNDQYSTSTSTDKSKSSVTNPEPSTPSTTTPAATISTQTATTSHAGPGLHDLGVNKFGVTHNEFNDAMMKISSAANTIRQARLLLASVNPAIQGQNNNNPELPCGQESGQSGDNAKNGSTNRTSSQSHDQTAASGDQTKEIAANSKELVSQGQPAEDTEETPAVETASQEGFRQPILVKSIEESRIKQPQTPDKKEGNSTTRNVADTSISSTAADLKSTPTQSGLTREQDQPTHGSQISSCTSTRNAPLSLNRYARPGGNLSRRYANPARTPWSLRMTPSEYQAARIARFPRIYGPLFRPSGGPPTSRTINRNLQSTSLGSAREESNAVPPLGVDRGVAAVSERVSSSSDQQSLRGDSGVNSNTTALVQNSAHMKVRHTITLEDFKSALAMALRKLQKSDGWTCDEKNISSSVNPSGMCYSNAFTLTETDSVNIMKEHKDERSEHSGSADANARHQTPQTPQLPKDAGGGDGTELIKMITEVERISIIQPDILEENIGYNRSEHESKKDMNDDKENKDDNACLPLTHNKTLADKGTTNTASHGNITENGIEQPLRMFAHSPTSVKEPNEAHSSIKSAESSRTQLTSGAKESSDSQSCHSSKESSGTSERYSCTRSSTRVTMTGSDIQINQQETKISTKIDDVEVAGMDADMNSEKSISEAQMNEEIPHSNSLVHSLSLTDSSYRDTIASLESYHEEIQLTKSEFVIYNRHGDESMDTANKEEVSDGLHDATVDRIIWPSGKAWRSSDGNQRQKRTKWRRRDAVTSTNDKETGFLSASNESHRKSKGVGNKSARASVSHEAVSGSQRKHDINPRMAPENTNGGVSGDHVVSVTPTAIGEQQKDTPSPDLSEETVTMKSESAGSSVGSVFRRFAFIRRRPVRPISYKELCKIRQQEENSAAPKPLGSGKMETECMNANNEALPDGGSDTQDGSRRHSQGIFVTASGTRLKSILTAKDPAKTPNPSLATHQETSCSSLDPHERKDEAAKRKTTQLLSEAIETISGTEMTKLLSTQKIEPRLVEETTQKKPQQKKPLEPVDSVSLSSGSSSVDEMGVTRDGTILETPPSSPALIAPTVPVRQSSRPTRQGFTQRLRRFFSRCLRVFTS